MEDFGDVDDVEVGDDDLKAGGQKEEEKEQEPRYGDDAPPMLRGKTMSEATELFGQAEHTIRTMGSRLQAMEGGVQQNVPVEEEPPELPEFDPEDLMDGNQDRFRSKLEQFFQVKAAPFMSKVAKDNATILYTQQMNDPLFQRFKPEVDNIVSRLQPQAVADPNTWTQIRQYLISNNFDTLAEEYVRGNQNRAAPQNVHRTKNQTETGSSDNVTLTPEDKTIIRKLGLNAKEYLASKKRMME